MKEEKEKSVMLKLKKDDALYIEKRILQGHSAAGYFQMLLQEDILRQEPRHTDIANSLFRAIGDLQKMKRRINSGHPIGLSEIEAVEKELNHICQKI